MTGDDFSAGIQTGTLGIYNGFTGVIRVTDGFITKNNTEFVFIENQPKIHWLGGVGILNNVGDQIVKNSLKLFQIYPKGEITFNAIFQNHIKSRFFNGFAARIKQLMDQGLPVIDFKLIVALTVISKSMFKEIINKVDDLIRFIQGCF